jgi:polyphenol oxidase
MLKFIIPEWPAPRWIKALTTTRSGGFSPPPFASLNLSFVTGDNLNCVHKNHQLLKRTLNLDTNSIAWLKQIHGNKAISANIALSNPIADAVYSKEPQVVCAVLTADCLPLLVCSRTQHCVAAIHAGWKGLAAGIIENCINTLDCPANDLLIWLGPAIGPQAFVVGEEVINVFLEQNPKANTAFQRINSKQWLANLYQLAKQRLCKLGINAIYGGHYCTYTDKLQFYSFRRDKLTGRMASLIWIDHSRSGSTH